MSLAAASTVTAPANALPQVSQSADDLLPAPTITYSFQESNRNNREALLKTLHAEKTNDIYCETVTENDALPIDTPTVNTVNGPAVNDFGETFTWGQQCFEFDGKDAADVTARYFRGNSDAYISLPPDFLERAKLGINQDSTAYEISKGRLNLEDGANTYSGGNISFIGNGLNPRSNGAQNLIHRDFLKNLGFNNADPNPPVFDKDGPSGGAISYEAGICSKDLIQNSSLNLNACAQGELGLGYLENNGLNPYTKGEALIQFGYNFAGDDSNLVVPSPLGVTSLPSKQAKNSIEPFIRLKADCNVNDPTGVIGINGSPADECSVDGEIGTALNLSDEVRIEMSLGDNFASTNPTNYNNRGQHFLFRIRQKK